MKLTLGDGGIKPEGRNQGGAKVEWIQNDTLRFERNILDHVTDLVLWDQAHERIDGHRGPGYSRSPQLMATFLTSATTAATSLVVTGTRWSPSHSTSLVLAC